MFLGKRHSLGMGEGILRLIREDLAWCLSLANSIASAKEAGVLTGVLGLLGVFLRFSRTVNSSNQLGNFFKRFLASLLVFPFDERPIFGLFVAGLLPKMSKNDLFFNLQSGKEILDPQKLG